MHHTLLLMDRILAVKEHGPLYKIYKFKMNLYADFQFPYCSLYHRD